MGSVIGFIGQFLGMSLLGAMSIGPLPSCPCENLSKLHVAAVRPNSSVREQNNTEDLFRKLNVRHRWQEARLIRLSGVRTYKLENLRGHLKTGQRWSLQNRPTESGLGLSCFTPPPPVEASLFSCANSADRI